MRRLSNDSCDTIGNVGQDFFTHSDFFFPCTFGVVKNWSASCLWWFFIVVAVGPHQISKFVQLHKHRTDGVHPYDVVLWMNSVFIKMQRRSRNESEPEASDDPSRHVRAICSWKQLKWISFYERNGLSEWVRDSERKGCANVYEVLFNMRLAFWGWANGIRQLSGCN